MTIQDGESVVDVSRMSEDNIYEQIIKPNQGFLLRENWYFGRFPHYKLGDGRLATQYGGKLYISQAGQLHPEMVADLKANWHPVSGDAARWKRDYLKSRSNIK